MTSLVVYIRVITKLPNTEQSSKGKVKTHKSTDKIVQQQENRNGPDLVQAFLKKWWVESDFTAHIVLCFCFVCRRLLLPVLKVNSKTHSIH